MKRRDFTCAAISQTAPMALMRPTTNAEETNLRLVYPLEWK